MVDLISLWSGRRRALGTCGMSSKTTSFVLSVLLRLSNGVLEEKLSIGSILSLQVLDLLVIFLCFGRFWMSGCCFSCFSFISVSIREKKGGLFECFCYFIQNPLYVFYFTTIFGALPFFVFFEGTRRGEFVWRDFWMGIFLWLLVKMRFGEIRVRVFGVLLILKSSKLFWMKG